MWLVASIIVLVLGPLTIFLGLSKIYMSKGLRDSNSNKVVTILLRVILWGWYLVAFAALGSSITYGLLIEWDLVLYFMLFFEVSFLIVWSFFLRYLWQKGIFSFS